MSEDFEELETELASLKPEQPSPRLKQRIADQIQDKSQSTTPGWSLWARQIVGHPSARLAFAAGLAASALLAFMLRPQRQAIVADPPADMPQLAVAAAFDDSLPSVWNYQRALSRSPGELEALLEKHASLSSPAAPTPNYHFIRSDRDLLLQGEL